MAKFCDVCKQPYPDDQPVCPHCAAAHPVERSQPGPSDSAIDYGTSPVSEPPVEKAGSPESPSSASVVEWAALVEDVGSPRPGEEVRIDSPSDADLLAHARSEGGPVDSGDVPAEPAQPPAASPPPKTGKETTLAKMGKETTLAPPEELVGELTAAETAAPAAEPPPGVGVEAEMVDLAHPPARAAMPGSASEVDLGPSPPARPAMPGSESEVDLGAGPIEVVEEGSGIPLEQVVAPDSDVFVAELASDAARVELVSDSGVNLVEEELVTAAPPAGQPQAGDESPSSRDLIAEAVESGTDLQNAGEEPVEVVAAEEEPSSAVDLGAKGPPPGTGEQPISEAVIEELAVAPPSSSTVDLEGLPVPPAPAAAMHPPTDSSVDLGSHGDIGELVIGSGSREAPAGSESVIDLEGTSEPAPAAEEAIDLESIAAGPAEEAVVAEEEPVAAEAEEAAVAAEGETPPVSEEDVDALLAGIESEAAAEEEPVAAGEEGEAATEAAEEEQAAAEEVEEEPARPVKPRSRIPALVGGIVLGTLLGAGGAIGARAVMGPSESANKPTVPGPTARAAPAVSAAQWMELGEFQKAAENGIEQGNDPVQRGEWRWITYLQKQRAAKAPLKADDPAVKQAMDDFKQAGDNNAHAVYWLGNIYEMTGDPVQARAIYAKGAETFKNDPQNKRIFDAALNRLDTQGPARPAGAFLPPSPPSSPPILGGEKGGGERAMLALLLIGFQPPQPPQGQPPAGQPPQAAGEPEEAGFDFWQAVKLARQQKYADAIKAIDKAKALHDQRRFTRLRKAQNPISDPTEEIFLRGCDELKAYWQTEDKLRGGGYLAAGKTAPQAVGELIKKSTDSEMTAKALAGKLNVAKPEDVVPAVDKLLADKKAADTKVVDLGKMLTTSRDQVKDLTTKLATANNTIKDRDTKLKDAVDRETKLKGDVAAANATLKTVADDLVAAKYTEAGKPDVVQGVKKALQMAAVVDPQGQLRKLQTEVERDRAELKQRWRPDEMLAVWLPLLQQDRGRKDLAAKAVLDAQRVKANPAATPARKSQADLVLGLSLRNEEKFDQARPVLEKAKTGLAAEKSDWLPQADAALREVANPSAYFTTRAETLFNQGQTDAALAVIGHGLQVLPKDQGRLLAQRSLIELDAAASRAKGLIPPTDPQLASARKDAAAAIKAGAIAEGQYAAGRIAEEVGRWDAAAQAYRAALAAHPALDAQGSRYRIALARVLVQPREARPGQPAPKVGWRAGGVNPLIARTIRGLTPPARRQEEMKALALLLVGFQPPGGLPVPPPGQAEAERLADEILKAPPETVPFDVRAQALAVKGRWTQALITYAEGLRAFLPREYGRGLLVMIQTHPRLKLPDSLRVPNPMEAEKHYAAGLNFYFDRNYADAEKELLAAVYNDGQDARYYYFLGLSRLAQNKRDAYEDFDQGAALEQLNRPAPAIVSAALERIQGPVRRVLNEARNRPR